MVVTYDQMLSFSAVYVVVVIYYQLFRFSVFHVVVVSCSSHCGGNILPVGLVQFTL